MPIFQGLVDILYDAAAQTPGSGALRERLRQIVGASYPEAAAFADSFKTPQSALVWAAVRIAWDGAVSDTASDAAHRPSMIAYLALGGRFIGGQRCDDPAALRFL